MSKIKVTEDQLAEIEKIAKKDFEGNVDNAAENVVSKGLSRYRALRDHADRKRNGESAPKPKKKAKKSKDKKAKKEKGKKVKVPPAETKPKTKKSKKPKGEASPAAAAEETITV